MNSPDLIPSFLKMVSALAVTLGIMLITIYLLKKAMKRTGVVNDGLMKILSTQYLGPKNSIMLIDVLGDILVIGVSSNQISLLTKIVDHDSREQLKNIQGQGGKNPPFSDYLMRYKTKIFSHGHFLKRDEGENV
ncbi:MAG: flagellar biosynthetic protein FliO [Deltaproteobacteria bacterium]|nr:flagellar biosynthetic protein FliO [Deltaproteobacteria bacterium]MBW1718202.1 flagellar biosynthetic protein FliO [Deltaproteobacteria bacterium]MBW1938164.1 flagellar biosynthetic protein FliO [Deltaproteobacteria bacterium]